MKLDWMYARFLSAVWMVLFSTGTGVFHAVAQEDAGGSESESESATPAATLEPGGESPVRIVNIDDLKPPVDQLMKEAVGLQKSEQYARAAAVYADALRYYPDSNFREEIVFRLAECYRSLGRYPEAKEMLGLLETEFKGGEWSAPADLLAGEMDASEEKWVSAREHFRLASGSEQAALRSRALYFAIISSIRMDQLKEAKGDLNRLAGIKEECPYRDFAWLKLGELSALEKKDKEAEDFFQKTLSQTTSPELRAEAAVRLGNLLYGRKRYPDAIAYYEMVRKLNAPEVWKELSHLGLIQSYFARKGYEDVVRVFNEVKPKFPADLRASIFFMVGESYRLIGQDKDKEALRTYDVVLRDFPKSPLAQASLWASVMILQRQNAPALAEEAARYIAKYPDAPEVTQAQLIRADVFFRKRDFKTAGPMYDELLKRPEQVRKISDPTWRQVLLRSGICAYDLGDYAKAVRQFDVFLNTEGGREEKKQAIWLLGQAYLAQKKLKESIAPLRILVDDYRDFKDREDLLWKLSYVYGNLKDYAGMKKMLLLLNREFKNDGRKGELYSWLAVSSQETGAEKEAFDYWGKARLLDSRAYFERATRYRIQYALKNKLLDVLSDEVGRYDAWMRDHPKVSALSTDIYEWLAQEYDAKGQEEKAEMYYRKVLALSPSSEQEKRTRLKLSRMMSRLQRYGAAAREWEIFRKKYPDDADRTEVLAPLAEAYLGSAEFDKAESLTEQILRQNPEGENNSLGRILLGDIAVARHEFSEGAKIYRTVALLAMDQVYAPMALSKAEQAFRRGGNEKEADQMLLKLKKEYPDYKGKGETGK